MLKTIPELINDLKEQMNVVSIEDALSQQTNNKSLIIDVREPSEFAQQGAKDVINIPRGLLEMKMLQMYPDENLAIFIHCATGARAILSAEQLQRIGYNNVSVISTSLEDICKACG